MNILKARANRDVSKVNLLYLITLIGLYFIGGYFQNLEIYTGLLISEFLILLLPSIYFIFKKM